MIKKHIPMLSIVAMSFIACGGGGGGTSSNDNTNSYKIHAYAADNLNEYLDSDYKYCADMNKNEKCDLNEPSVKFQKNTKVTLSSVHSSLQTANIILTPFNTQRSLKEDKKPIFASKSSTDNSTIEINLKTSIEVALNKAGFSQKQINDKIQQMGFTSDTLSNNEIINKNLIKLLTPTDVISSDKIYSNLGKTLSQNKINEMLSNANFDTNVPSFSHVNVLNDTGVKKFYDGNQAVDVKTISQNEKDDIQNNFPDQDAKFGYDATDGGFQFVGLDALGNENNSNYSCIKDKRTGLIWEVKSSNPLSPNYSQCVFALDIQEPYYYEKELQKAKELNKGKCPTRTGVKDLHDYKNSSYVKYLNANNYCGKSNWRLPTFNEYYNILNFSLNEVSKVNNINIHTTLDRAYFSDLPSAKIAEKSDLSGAYYWTSTLTQGVDGETDYLKKIAIIAPVAKYPFQKSSMNFCAKHPNGSDDVACESPTPLYLRLVSQGEK